MHTHTHIYIYIYNYYRFHSSISILSYQAYYTYFVWLIQNKKTVQLSTGGNHTLLPVVEGARRDCAR